MMCNIRFDKITDGLDYMFVIKKNKIISVINRYYEYVRSV